MNIFWVSLGCSKNLISSEEMLFAAREAGHVSVSTPQDADVAVVNTCGFIESARRESVENILELAAFKPKLKILVAGCMAERYKEEVFSEMPEVDGLLGCGSFDELCAALTELENGGKPCRFGVLDKPLDATPRLRTTPDYTAYLRIADGCDNRCSYCVIPSLRGPYRSRSFESLIDETAEMVRGGVREIIVIAQDTTRYGLDLYGKRRLAELLRELCKIEDLTWLRLHYLYPDEINDELIDVIADEDKIVKYLDIPIQHCCDRMLHEMNRRGTKADLTALFAKLRERIEGVVLRTSLIVGFPGETEEEFLELCEFVKEQRFERAGVFAYSEEEETPAGKRGDQIDEFVKARRQEQLQNVSGACMDAYNEHMEGKIIYVLCEGYDRYAGVYFGRTYADSPDVDGRLFFTSRKPISPGAFVRVHVTDCENGDLYGKAREGAKK